ncbi:hypothetical protein A3F27_01310 [Candidatus Kaiserbacteria bacterium RIFCSPHIGHO2_12_FULL_53_13]|uniref:Homing endonuclease LAGLIDADG domain-containing protein n=1 Tax=Candidatus Kaiserbacteria bacterium RIFCSPHIGHO2_12_FULL_53_13 TaxID=1798502 RepID=A0A1F6E682_9BACT|nr:MAG: hypothetical protein A3F27_01310 [Candidatus Kaiserbacteria bacterium RIFCSPHIGHO2_12_FULL_53_13]
MKKKPVVKHNRTTLSNQQETRKAYIAGIFDGEGTFSMTQYRQRNGYMNSRICIGVANTDRDIIKAVVDFFRKNAISYYLFVNDRRNIGRKIQYQLEITKHQNKTKFIDLIYPYLRKNRELAELFKDFCEYRQTRWEQWKKDGANGKFANKYLTAKEDKKYLMIYKKYREKADTISKTLYDFGGAKTKDDEI